MGPLPAAVATPLSSARAAVLAQLAEADGQPLRAQQIANALGQHVNTTREHLEGLVADHLAEATTEAPRGRGRPATLYRCMPGGPMWPIGRQYAALADVLVEQVLESVDDPQAAAFRAGERWGRKLLADAPADLSAQQVVDRQLAEVGFAPEHTGDGEWRLVRCPLLTAARLHPDVVCNVHRGVVASLLDGLGEPSEVSIFPFSEPGACRISARPTSSRPTSSTTPAETEKDERAAS
ncbi:Predicted transcriptional regulator, ArsR family [Raineyella antarctica]|uniref:Predicted transcriptional regulator, ArsR family n=2 Tax=Raineyella antarctica TaxID=1577474 RepID=A0A1G6GY52_9ACTN|nr:Predicted transcriptional regulator, ArsR family [Raineyella antarctica]